MKLILIDKQYRVTKNNSQPYITLKFKNLDNGKEATYNIWGFVHNKEESLKHIWDEAQKAMIGDSYILHFQKMDIQGQLQFIVTCLKRL